VLAEVPFFAKDGTITNADRRIVRQRPAGGPSREEHGGVAILAALGNALGGELSVTDAASVMAEAAGRVPGYVRYDQLQSGRTRALAQSRARPPELQAVSPPVPVAGGLVLTTGRSLYTTWEGASLRSEEADKLHREEAVVMHPADAETAGIRAGDAVVLSDGTNEVRITARLDGGVAPGSVYVPHYYDGGAIMALLPLDEGTAATSVVVRARALQPA
jgi:predicted molibdopterin-dependent oxidoreductase YjgC